MAQRIKHQPAMPETQDRSLGQEDPLEEGMAIHSSIGESQGQRRLTGYPLQYWRIPGTEEADGLQSMGLQRVGHE